MISKIKNKNINGYEKQRKSTNDQKVTFIPYTLPGIQLTTALL